MQNAVESRRNTEVKFLINRYNGKAVAIGAANSETLRKKANLGPDTASLSMCV